MAWERRERGGLYYTRSKKVDGEVVREYIGSGLLGQFAAMEDERQREEKRQRAAFEREERERLEEALAPVEELDEAAEVLARAALLAGGYHRHKRGEWRKRRE
jgi:hypothetical protein